jgi:hypothetical protein
LAPAAAAVAGLAPAAAAVAGLAAAAEAVAGLAAPMAVAGASVIGRAFTGAGRGIGRTSCVPGLGGTRAAAAALTRCSSSAARSGARPAHSRRRLSSRACEKNSSERIAIPISAANAAMAPTFVNESESESASSEGVMNPESV